MCFSRWRRRGGGRGGAKQVGREVVGHQLGAQLLPVAVGVAVQAQLVGDGEVVDGQVERFVAVARLLEPFGDGEALDVADALTEKLFTLLAQDIQKEYLFHGA